ncbi:hypothetical protein [Stieleria varia]|uniref:Uncharacterized protein n=1 Tax=Stieleria varia TaxID=2528005 RepID=A0A5C5ZQ48_9BACT|nr:hypothetical protein [Stieleria varia]TWT89599.1 hypothetical protein Pla52n_67260 [Stieleria varia]
MTANPFLHIRSAKLRILPGEDDELVNEGMYGKACAQYLQTSLAGRGYSVPFVVCEDWGWWVDVKGLDFTCGIGVYGIQIDDSGDLDLCVTVLTPKGKKWSWTKLRSIDTSAEVDKLHETIRSIFEDDVDVTIVCESPDFPLE